MLPDPTALRAFVIDLHLVALAVAGLGVALGDWALFGGRQIERRRLGLAVAVITVALAGLWLSGLWLVALDSGWPRLVSQIASQPRLLAKFSVVALLTLNGIALQRWGLPRLFSPLQPPRVLLPMTLGALCMCGWLYATFLGLAGRLTPGWSYATFMSGFALLLMLSALLCLGPLRASVARRLSRSEALLRPLAGWMRVT
jgi:hypothetical protein